MTIFGITRIRNESFIIRDTLDHFGLICDGGIFVYDDMSTDDTVGICRAHPSVITIIQGTSWDYNRERAEFENRQAIFLECAKISHKDDWLLYFDADERLEF